MFDKRQAAGQAAGRTLTVVLTRLHQSRLGRMLAQERGDDMCDTGGFRRIGIRTMRISSAER